MKESLEILATEKTMVLKQHLRGIFNVLVKPIRRDLTVQLGLEKGFAFAQKQKSDMQHGYEVFSNSSTLIKFLIFAQLVFLLVIFTGVILFLYFERLKIFKHSKKLLLLIIVCYFANLNTPPVSNSRLRVPFLPFILALSVSGFYLINKNSQSSKSGH